MPSVVCSLVWKICCADTCFGSHVHLLHVRRPQLWRRWRTLSSSSMRNLLCELLILAHGSLPIGIQKRTGGCSYWTSLFHYFSETVTSFQPLGCLYQHLDSLSILSATSVDLLPYSIAFPCLMVAELPSCCHGCVLLEQGPAWRCYKAHHKFAQRWRWTSRPCGGALWYEQLFTQHLANCKLHGLNGDSQVQLRFRLDTE